jgi:hypothetical protein
MNGLTVGFGFFHSPFDRLRANGKILNCGQSVVKGSGGFNLLFLLLTMTASPLKDWQSLKPG